MKFIRKYILFLFLWPALLWADTYPEVVFDNSLVSGSYAKSRVVYSGHSWVENVNKHLLVSDTLFFTPGNALSLKYISAKEGDWNVAIRYSRQKFLYRVLHTDFLTFRLYVKSGVTSLDDLPELAIQQKDTTTVPISLRKYVVDFEHGKWVVVKIPCRDFKGLNHDAPINSIVFHQGRNSPHIHQLFIDQIEFLPGSYSTAKLSSPAVFTEAIAYDKMVHLKWQLPLTPSIRYIKVYRSIDGKEYAPTGIKPIHMQSSLDDVPVIGQKYYYKLTWLDYNYNESPFSEVREVQTKEMEASKLIDLVQLSHINYFVENYDINSGMYMPYRLKDKAVVSTKETGDAILAMIVGVERGLISKQSLFNRISKIVDFLTSAQHYHGSFPGFFDGRKAIPEYVYGKKIYDVDATVSIVEALLVARQYFSRDVDDEYLLRNKITALYDRVDWTKLTVRDSLDVLSKSILMNVDNEFEPSERVFAGPNYAINAYMMATGSSQHPLPIEAYAHSVYNRYDSLRYEKLEELEIDIHAELMSPDSIVQSRVSVLRQVDSLVRVSIVDSVWCYGEQLLLGEIDGSLMDLYRPFMTIRPRTISDSIFQWEDILRSYVHYAKRRDNELGVGVNNSDIWGFYQYRYSEGDYRINPAIGPAAMVVDAEVGERALLTLYHKFGKDLFTEYGFRAWLNLRDEDVSDEYIAGNQAALVVMIENARSGLIWDLYEQIPEFQLIRAKLFARDILE